MDQEIDYSALIAQVDETIVNTQAERSAPIQGNHLSDALRLQHSFMRMLLGRWPRTPGYAAGAVRAPSRAVQAPS